MEPVSVIVLAYGEEPLLQRCVDAILNSSGVQTEVILVDNGSPSVMVLADSDRLRVLTPNANLGFAGGCNFASEFAKSNTLVFVNSDLIVHEAAIARLTARLGEESVGLATGAVLLPGDPPRVNSIGNPIHYLMFSWAGSFGEPFNEHDHDESVAGVSGALFGCRREHWNHVRGFDEQFFAYAEDADLSLRTWQGGRRIVFEPTAVGIHHYEFTKNTRKWFLLERNRLITFFTLYEPRSILLLLPVLLPVEVGILWASYRGGWAKEKLSSWWWLATHGRYLRQRRQAVSAQKVVAGTAWTSVLQGRMDIPGEFGLRVPEAVNRVLDAYWGLVRRHVR
jgi:GT2 family glycosyltransferase